MIIAGCEYNRVKNFPDWEYNLRFDLAVQQQVEKQYPGLMRPILFSERKYNMDMTRNSFCWRWARTATLWTKPAIPLGCLPSPWPGLFRIMKNKEPL